MAQPRRLSPTFIIYNMITNYMHNLILLVRKPWHCWNLFSFLVDIVCMEIYVILVFQQLQYMQSQTMLFMLIYNFFRRTWVTTKNYFTWKYTNLWGQGTCDLAHALLRPGARAEEGICRGRKGKGRSVEWNSRG